MSNSLAPECNIVKENYETCFLKWYSEKFLKGTAVKDDCEHLLKKYQACLQKSLKEKGIDKMIDEARKDNEESDFENMRRGK